MRYRTDGYNWIVRLNKGEKLVISLTKLVEQENIPSCWVNVIGACSNVTLGYYDLETQAYQWHNINELMEITNITGNLSFIENKPHFHLHGTFSKKDLSVVGGHVQELIVGGTCEVFLHKWYSDKLTRFHNEEVGLKLLDL